MDKQQITPIWFLGIGQHEDLFYHENSLYIGNEKSIDLKHKIWLENYAYFYGNLKFMDKIYRCDIKYLTIMAFSTPITYTEYNILVQSEKIKEIVVFSVFIKMENGEDASLEKLMEKLPNAHKISIILKAMRITANSTETLANLKRNVKIQKFEVFNLNEDFEPHWFCNFLKNNLTQNSDFHLAYSKTIQISENYQRIMSSAIEAIVRPFQENQLPKVLIRFLNLLDM